MIELGRGLTIANPLMMASGTFGVGDKWPEHYGVCGAFVAKTVTPEPRPGNPPPRIAETASGIVNRVGLQNPGIDAFAEFLRGLSCPTVFIASVHATSVSEVELMLDKLAGIPVIAGYELNLSCPNTKRDLVLPAVDAERIEAIVEAARARTEAWLCAKLPPYTCIEVAPVCEAAGADALCVSNTFPAVTYDPQGRRVQGGLSGPAVKPMALYNVFQTAKRVSIPIIASGGARCGRDVVEFIQEGARAVQLGSVNFVEPGAAARILAELPGEGLL